VYKPGNHILLRELISSPGNNAPSDFEQRLIANFDCIYGILQGLYGDKINQYLEPLVLKMQNAYESRSIVLRDQDIRREIRPDWFLSQDLVGMMLYVDRYSQNLSGFIDRINYLEDLGVNLVHLMPLLECPEENNDGGYAVSDFRAVNPKLGSMDDIEEISSIFRDKGMYLMLDLAINHTSEEHIWAKKARAGEKEFQDYYYFHENREIPDQYEQSLPEVFPETAPGNFTYIAELDQWVMTVFHDYQWDLNYTNPTVFIEMLDNLLFLANKGVDIIRLDALAFTWKKIGTSSQNLHEAHQIIKAFKACCQVVAPGTIFLAEAIVAPNEIIKYFGESNQVSNECDLAYNATLMTLLWESVCTKNNRLLHTTLEHIPDKPKGTSWLNYLRCHDDIGLGYEDLHAGWSGYDPRSHRRFIIDFLTGKIDWSFANGAKFMEDLKKGDARISGTLASLAGLEKAVNNQNPREIDLAIHRIIMLHSLILSYGGIPMLYMGDELGMTNDYTYESIPGLKSDNRWMHRPKMNWTQAELRFYETKVEGRIFQALAQLIAIRKSSPEFADYSNRIRIDCRNEHVFGFVRYLDHYRTFCVFNLNDHPEPLYGDVLIQQGFKTEIGIVDRITEKSIELKPNLLLEPYACMWLSENPNK
jgi:amylosucrase